MRAIRLVLLAGLIGVGASLLAGCSSGGKWWDPCPGPDCGPIGDPCDCCDSCSGW